uniref:Vesicle transport protein n=1 Tax=Phasianus colchicus TaxID=9054 RepID=A0A669R620_PHACC
MDKLKRVLSGRDAEEPGALAEVTPRCRHLPPCWGRRRFGEGAGPPVGLCAAGPLLPAGVTSSRGPREAQARGVALVTNGGNARLLHAPFQVIDATSLGWGTRVKGFIACFALGCVFSVLVSAGCSELGRAREDLFSSCFVFLFHSTLFLMGPMKQLKRMFEPTRLIATIVMLLCLILTLCSAFWWRKEGLALLFFISLMHAPHLALDVTCCCSLFSPSASRGSF